MAFSMFNYNYNNNYFSSIISRLDSESQTLPLHGSKLIITLFLCSYLWFYITLSPFLCCIPGLCLWPYPFNMYTTPLRTFISSRSLNHHFYADDTQLLISFAPKNIYHRNKSTSRYNLRHLILDDL